MRLYVVPSVFLLLSGCSNAEDTAQTDETSGGEAPHSGGSAPTASSEGQPSTVTGSQGSDGTSTGSTGPSSTPSPEGTTADNDDDSGTDEVTGATRSDDASGSSDDATGSDGSTGSDDTGTDDDGTESYDDLVADLVPDATCTWAVHAEVSTAIATVGIVTLDAPEGALEAGYVEYGLDESYGMRAPLNRRGADYRTVLLGMRQASDYHYRVVARSADGVCASEDSVVSTGTAPADLELPEVETPLPQEVEPGFLITSITSNDYVVIYDDAGALVWWFQTSMGLVTRATLSWDGHYIYARDANEAGGPGGEVLRISVDGLSAEPVTIDTGHHDMAAAPGNSMLFLTGGGCGGVHRLSADDELSLVYDFREAFGTSSAADPCHCNSIEYNAEDDSITVSCLYQNAYVKISAEGELLWILVGNDDVIGNRDLSDFSGDLDWGQGHGHHMVAPDRILFFNNQFVPEPAIVRELQLDLDAGTATEVWTYEGGQSSATLGDVQRLAGGNTLVTYSNRGIIREVNASQALVRSWNLPGVGYSMHVPVLYGPPATP